MVTVREGDYCLLFFAALRIAVSSGSERGDV